ncbi:hypothetical protein FJZ17_01610 [Candidatus Pacearchaeota archaeon]|nr:hypothetical protein [Candidatus Pacearchaeota archaeon]
MLNKKTKPECVRWGIRWAIAVIITLIAFSILRFAVEKMGGSGILEALLLISLILLSIFSSPLEWVLAILPGTKQITILSCKITGCVMNLGGIITIVIIWFMLGLLVGAIIGNIKKKINQPSYLKTFRVR